MYSVSRLWIHLNSMMGTLFYFCGLIFLILIMFCYDLFVSLLDSCAFHLAMHLSNCKTTLITIPELLSTRTASHVTYIYIYKRI